MEHSLCFLEYKLPFWNHLKEKQKLLNATTKKTYGAGEQIHESGADSAGVLIVTSGELRSYILSSEGKEITLYRITNDEMCTLSASSLIDTINFEIHLSAEKETTVYSIDSAVFLEIQENNIYVENFMLKAATIRFSDVMWIVMQILFYSLDKRLATFILKEVENTGNKTINLTHEQIARYIGSARETVSRILKHFQTEGLISINRGEFTVLDIDKLSLILSWFQAFIPPRLKAFL